MITEKHLTKIKGILTFNKVKEFLTYDYFWRCFKLSFYTVLVGMYFSLYFEKANLYAPFFDNGLYCYKIVCTTELFLSFCYLFLVVGGAFKYKNLSIRHHKVWFWIFMLMFGLWFTTVWYKFAIVLILSNDNGLLYRSPLQNLVTQWFYGISFHYEPGVYLVHKTWLISPFDLQTIVHEDGYVDTVKYYNVLYNQKDEVLDWYNYNPNTVHLYSKALRKFILSFKTIAYLGEERFLDKNFFYYWEL